MACHPPPVDKMIDAGTLAQGCTGGDKQVEGLVIKALKGRHGIRRDDCCLPIELHA
jgi:hypothetical protein